MTDSHSNDSPATSNADRRVISAGQWAPWWLYLIVLLGANYLRNYLFPSETMPVPLTVAIAVGQAALLFLLITALWRVTRRGNGS